MGKIDIKIEGLDKIKKDLEELQNKIKEHEDEFVPLTELLKPEFMQKYTEFSDFDEMLESGEFVVESQEDLEKLLSSTQWDNYVVDITKFKGWDEMLQTANKERISKNLGFK